MNEQIIEKLEKLLNRRDFLKGSSLASMALVLGSGKVIAQADNPAAALDVDNPVKIGVIGCGVQGREILENLTRLKNARINAICEHYPAWLRRAGRIAPDAKGYEDYRDLLKDSEVEAVIIATPTHQHKDIALAAMKAGKHIYLEAPVANTIEDSKAICSAAKANPTIYFQAGLQLRSEPQRWFLVDFIRSGALGNTIGARSQWHKKTSMRRASPNGARETELNWPIQSQHSPGLISELGIHQIDNALWFLNQRPVAVSGFGGIHQWKDGRDVEDTFKAVFEFENGRTYDFSGTIANSFDAAYDMYHGTDCAIMFRDDKSWMFKETDAPLLGWEVYARKDVFYKETGIYLAANATKLTTQDKGATSDSNEQAPVYYALEAFLTNAYLRKSAVADFIDAFGEADPDSLKEYLAEIGQNQMPAAGPDEGHEATATVILANQAIRGKKRVEISPDLLTL